MLVSSHWKTSESFSCLESRRQVTQVKQVAKVVKVKGVRSIQQFCASTGALVSVSSGGSSGVAKRREPIDKEGNNKENWGRRIRNDKVDNILRECSLTGKKFVDEEFPASEVSLYVSAETRESKKAREGQFFKGSKKIAGWRRPQDIREGGSDEEWVLIKDPCPSDICQGELGNCWFVAALALLAERKELLSKILVSTEMSPAGLYVVRFFKDGTWRDVIVDDFLPCDTFHRLVFSSCRRKQLWVPLIEKAMSKLHGSYESLQSGSIWDGLNYLTGYASERIFLKSETDREFLWGRLLSFYSSGFLMGATISSSKNAETLYESKGLVANHVYSILKVVATDDGNRLIQLHNPWGRFSWNGDWSDSSPLWSSSLRQELSPNKSQEGIFWMSYHHFMKYFSCLDVCKVRANWKTYSLDGLLPPFADQDCQPCFEVLVGKGPTAEVDICLYQSSRRNSHQAVTLTDIGFLVFETAAAAATTADGPSKPPRLLSPVDLGCSARRRCVTTSLMLAAGSYIILPISFGHWTAKESKETYYACTLTIQSSREISCAPLRPPSCAYILADGLISYAQTFGKRKQFSQQDKYQGISLLTVNLGVGHYTVMENRSEEHVHLEMDSRKSDNYSSTRDSFLTTDYVPPNHCQVLQLLTAQEPRKPSKISNAYQLHVHNNELHSKLKDKEGLHSPPVTNRISGLHKPRCI